MTLFHVTTVEAAAAILGDGFRDGQGFYMLLVDEPIRGVFLSDHVLDGNEGVKGGTVLAVAVDLAQLDEWELVEEPDDKGYREWCVPATLLNATATVRRVGDCDQ
jgi:hypothetical protein